MCEVLELLLWLDSLHKKMKFSIKDFFNKRDQIRSHVYWRNP